MRRRGGITVVYTIIAMAAILGLCSLGMDYGRVQLAKYELRRAVDAAARAGALNLRQGGDATTARAAAVAVAAENTVDGNVLTLTASHVLVGNWNSTTKSFTDGGTPTNAVRVTVTLGKATNNGIPLTFARVLGMASCDVSAGATALGSLATSAGFVGLDGVEVGNNVEFAGYDSSAGEPGGPNVSNNGHVASNAGVTIGMNGTVRGDVVLGPGGDLTT
ncbi:MAG TPA: TadG family pilus assembly protein, partial [Tepidisphaeraceae bacterium]|nr:TadG family pilus assembly protein [Tepidisphaeraceae bacterium]